MADDVQVNSNQSNEFSGNVEKNDGGQITREASDIQSQSINSQSFSDDSITIDSISNQSPSNTNPNVKPNINSSSPLQQQISPQESLIADNLQQLPPQNQSPVSNLPPTEMNSNNSNSINRPFPEELRHWNWGAFFLTWIWAIGNRTWIGLLALFAPISLIMAIILGINGNEWAWKSRKFESVDQFKAIQKIWAKISLILLILCFVVIAGMVIANVKAAKVRQNNAIKKASTVLVDQNSTQTDDSQTTAQENSQAIPNQFDITLPSDYKILANNNNTLIADLNSGMSKTNGMTISVQLQPKSKYDQSLLSQQNYYSLNPSKGQVTIETPKTINGENVPEYRITGNNGYDNFLVINNEIQVANNYYVAKFEYNEGSSSQIPQQNIDDYYKMLSTIKNK